MTKCCQQRPILVDGRCREVHHTFPPECRRSEPPFAKQLHSIVIEIGHEGKVLLKALWRNLLQTNDVGIDQFQPFADNLASMLPLSHVLGAGIERGAVHLVVPPPVDAVRQQHIPGADG